MVKRTTKSGTFCCGDVRSEGVWVFGAHTPTKRSKRKQKKRKKKKEKKVGGMGMLEELVFVWYSSEVGGLHPPGNKSRKKRRQRKS